MARRDEFSKLLKAQMTRLGLTQVAVAASLGVSPTAVGNWLKGTQPGSRYIAPLAELLEVDPSTLAELAGHSTEFSESTVARTSMSVDTRRALQEQLSAVFINLTEEGQNAVLLYAAYLGDRQWQEERKAHALRRLADATGSSEPAYTREDIQR